MYGDKMLMSTGYNIDEPARKADDNKPIQNYYSSQLSSNRRTTYEAKRLQE